MKNQFKNQSKQQLQSNWNNDIKAHTNSKNNKESQYQYSYYNPSQQLNYINTPPNEQQQQQQQYNTTDDYYCNNKQSTSNTNNTQSLDYLKKENEIENLDFINTLLRLKSTANKDKENPANTINSYNYNNYDNVSNIHMSPLPNREQSSIQTPINNDDSKSFFKEILDICDGNNGGIGRISDMQFNSNYNSNNNELSPKVTKGLKRNDLIEITNRRKKMVDSMTSVDPYLRRRHNEEMAKVEKLRKDKERKELGDGTFMPKINKRSKMICEKLNSEKMQNGDEVTNLFKAINKDNDNNEGNDMFIGDDDDKKLFANFDMKRIKNIANIIKETKQIEEGLNNNKRQYQPEQRQRQLQSNSNTTNTNHSFEINTMMIMNKGIDQNNHPPMKQERKINISTEVNKIKGNDERFDEYMKIKERERKKDGIEIPQYFNEEESNHEHNECYEKTYTKNNYQNELIKENKESEEAQFIKAHSSITIDNNNNHNINNTNIDKDDMTILNERQFDQENFNNNKEVKRLNLKAIKEEVRMKNLQQQQPKEIDSNIPLRVASHIEIPFDFSQFQLKSLMNQSNQATLIDKAIEEGVYSKPSNTLPNNPSRTLKQNNIVEDKEIKTISSYKVPSFTNDNVLPTTNNLRISQRSFKPKNFSLKLPNEEDNVDYIIDNPLPINELVKESNMSHDEDNNEEEYDDDAYKKMHNQEELIEEQCIYDKPSHFQIDFLSPNTNYYSDILGINPNSKSDLAITDHHSNDPLSSNILPQKVVVAEIDLFDEEHNEEEVNELSITTKNNAKVPPKSILHKPSNHITEAIVEDQIEFDIEELMNPKYMFKNTQDTSLLEMPLPINSNNNQKQTSSITIAISPEAKTPKSIISFTQRKEKQRNSKSVNSLERITSTTSTTKDQPPKKIHSNKTQIKPKPSALFNKLQSNTLMTPSNREINKGMSPISKKNTKKKFKFEPKKKNNNNNQPDDNSQRNKGNISNDTNLFQGGYLKRIIQQDKGVIDSLLQ